MLGRFLSATGVVALLVLTAVNVRAEDTVTATNTDCTPILTNIKNSPITIKNLSCCYGVCAEAETEKVKVTYYNLNSYTAAKLIQGQLPPDLQKLLGGDQPVIRNAVFENYKYLVDRFGVKSVVGECVAYADKGSKNKFGKYPSRQCSANVPLFPDAFLFPKV